MEITLKAARVNRGFTQSQAAKELGVTEDTVRNWERGKTYPDALHIRTIEKVYGVPFEKLLFSPRKSSSNDENES